MNPAAWGLVAIVLLLAYWLTGRLCSAASAVGLFDYPNRRSLHHRPTPNTGGLAILGSLAFGLILWLALVDRLALPPLSPSLRWALGSAFFVGLVSFVDACKRLSPGARLVLYAAAACVTLWGGDLLVSSLVIPFVGSVGLSSFAAVFSFLFLLWMMNLYNFMDGIDGLAGGMTVIGFGCLSMVTWRNGQASSLGVLAMLVAAGGAGFLLSNFPPARIFMGDVGSVPLGFLAGALSLVGVKQGMFDLSVPVLIFSPFIVDATVTLVRRLLRAQRIWEGHREHYYQRLILAGSTHLKVVLVEYGLMLACGLSAVVYLRSPMRWGSVVVFCWVAIYVGLAYCVAQIERQPFTLSLGGHR